MSSLTLDRPVPRSERRPALPPEPRTGGATRRALAPVGVLVALATLVVFVAVGASRMIEVTGHRSPAVTSVQHRPAGYGASLWPLGFTVHWTDGTAETHLWW